MNKSITLGEWTIEWLQVYKKHEVSATSYKNYEGSVARHILSSDIAAYPIIELKPIHIQKSINKLVQKGTMREAKFVYQIYKQIFDKAIYNDLLIKNLMTGIKAPKYTARIKKSLTKSEQALLLNAKYVSDEQKMFVEIGLYTGMRKGEILALTKEDVDINAKLIKVNKNLIFTKNKGDIKNTPKTKAGNRTIPLPDVLCRRLQEYINKRKKYLFENEKHEPITKSQSRDMWDEILKCANLNRHISIHYLRHTYATNLYYAGIDIKTAQYLLGHESSRMTIDLYTHLEQEENIPEACKKLSDYMSNYAIIKIC